MKTIDELKTSKGLEKTSIKNKKFKPSIFENFDNFLDT